MSKTQQTLDVFFERLFFVCLFGFSYLHEGLEQLDPQNNALELSMAKAIYCVLMMHLLSVDATVVQQK